MNDSPASPQNPIGGPPVDQPQGPAGWAAPSPAASSHAAPMPPQAPPGAGWPAPGAPANSAPTGWAPPRPGGYAAPNPGGYAAPNPGGFPPNPGYGPPMAGGYGPGGPLPLAQIDGVVQKSSRKGRFAAAGIGALALVGGGLFAATQLGGANGGAATPEAAVNELITAINHEDVLGVMNSLPKGERDAFLPMAQSSLSELKRLGVLSDKADLSSVAGLDIEFTGYRIKVDTVGDTVANTTISGGEIKGAYQLANLPMGEVIIDRLFDGEMPTKGASSTEPNTDDLELTTIKDADGWHVSLWYSVAEQARDDAGLPAPAFGRGVEAKGADSPQRAISDLFGAVGDLDVRRMIELTPPDEAAALHDYAPLFLPDAERAVDDLREQMSFELEVTPKGLTSTGSGDRRLVTMTGLSVSGTIGEADVDVDYDGGCVHYEMSGDGDAQGQQGEYCPADAAQGDDAMAALPDSYRTLLKRLADQPSGIEVVQRDGAWFVSPMGTMNQAMLRVLRALDQPLLEQLMDDGADVMDQGFGSGVLGLGSDGFGFGSNSGDLGSLGGSETSGGRDDSGLGGRTATTVNSSGVDQYYRVCMDLDSAVYAAETSATWLAAIQAAHACALPFLRSGLLDEYDIGTEIARPECYSAWPWDPSLTLAAQSALFDAIDTCLAKDPTY